MKRLLAAGLLLSLVVAAIYAIVATRRERSYRERVDQGEAALARNDTAAAITAFSAAIVLKPDSMLGYLKRGETYRRRNEFDTALPDLRRAAALDPLAPRPLELLGDVNASLKRPARAAEHYQACVQLDDRSSKVLYKLALALYRSDRSAAAVQALQRAIQIDSRFAEAHYLLGLCYRNLQKPEDSRAAFAQALSLSPELLPAREELSELYAHMGRDEDSISELVKLSGLDPRPSREVVLGLAYARAGQSQNAVLTLQRAAARYPEHPYTFVALGRVWLENAQASGDRVDLAKALGALENAVAAVDSSEALTLLGRALLLARDNRRAEHTLQRATERMPVDPLAFYFLAEAAERVGHQGVALGALLDYHALRGDTGNAGAARAFEIRVADLSMRTGDAARAAAWYERAIGHTDASVTLLIRLAEAQIASGAADRARVTLTRVLEKDPADRAAQSLLRRLR